MSKIKSKDTKIELTFRKALYRTGFRYRIHNRNILGTPDIANTKKKIVVFINGCFWHNHGCRISHFPKSNNIFWKKKIENNVKRDKEIRNILESKGWNVNFVWECEIKRNCSFAVNNIIKSM